MQTACNGYITIKFSKSGDSSEYLHSNSIEFPTVPR